MKRLKGHTSFVNSCYPARRGPQLVCTGSDDGTVKVSILCKGIVWNESKKGFLKEYLGSSHLSGLNSALHYAYNLLSNNFDFRNKKFEIKFALFFQ